MSRHVFVTSLREGAGALDKVYGVPLISILRRLTPASLFVLLGGGAAVYLGMIGYVVGAFSLYFAAQVLTDPIRAQRDARRQDMAMADEILSNVVYEDLRERVLHPGRLNQAATSIPSWNRTPPITFVSNA